MTSRINVGRGQLTGNADCRNLYKQPPRWLCPSWALPPPTGSGQPHPNHSSSQLASLCLGHHSIGHALLSKLRQPGKNSLALYLKVNASAWKYRKTEQGLAQRMRHRWPLHLMPSVPAIYLLASAQCPDGAPGLCKQRHEPCQGLHPAQL